MACENDQNLSSSSPPAKLGGLIRIRPVLFCAPVFWTPDYWSDSTHALDWVRPETALDRKPWAELEVSLDATLVDSFEVACDAWGIAPGPGMIKHGPSLAGVFERFAFVRADADTEGVAEQAGYVPIGVDLTHDGDGAWLGSNGELFETEREAWIACGVEPDLWTSGLDGGYVIEQLGPRCWHVRWSEGDRLIRVIPVRSGGYRVTEAAFGNALRLVA